MFKRIGLFILVNILVMVAGTFLINIIINLLGLGPMVSQQGLNYQTLMVVCLVWGMTGSFISLWISKWMAKRAYGVEILSPTGPSGQLVMRVHALARKAGLKVMPEVGIYESSEINAFATGASKKNSLVALSSGLLHRMDDEEAEGVIGHEISHIANGDMVTMTLVQGIVNAFVMFFSYVATFALESLLRGDDRDSRGGMGFLMRHFTYMFFQIIFGILAAPIVMGFSRFREYRADAGSAHICGKHKMIKALKALKRNYDSIEKRETNVAAFQISNKASLMELFSSHPPLDKRIQALERT